MAIPARIRQRWWQNYLENPRGEIVSFRRSYTGRLGAIVIVRGRAKWVRLGRLEILK